MAYEAARRAGWLILLATSIAGCWAGGAGLRPGLGRATLPAPTLLSLTVDCRNGTGGQDAGKEVIAQTHYGAALIEAVDGSLRGLGPGLPPLSSAVCDALLAREALDGDDWSAPVPPAAVAALLARYRAGALLVPVVSNGWRCLSEGEHATSCNENELRLAAYLFGADEVVWKGSWRLGVAHETPDLGGGVSALLEALPLTEVAQLQDPEAPTYERALEEAGVAP